ncbi:hypothetical protein EQV77_04715 [Halobacillus fulvus]|nr:hypothetical protein EQV77_04715 [Halobacillus fulvus]
MKHDPFQDETKLKERLNEYTAEMPEHVRNKGNFRRFISYLSSPTQNPLEPIMSKQKHLSVIQLIPIALTLLITFVQVLIFF